MDKKYKSILLILFTIGCATTTPSEPISQMTVTKTLQKKISLKTHFIDSFPDYKLKSFDNKNIKRVQDLFEVRPIKETMHAFKSLLPIDKRNTFLRFSLSVLEFDSEPKSLSAFETFFQKAKKDSGYAYARDFLIRVHHKLYWLELSCLYSKKNAGVIYEKLLNALTAKFDTKQIQCGCGTGCGLVSRSHLE